MPFIYQRTVRFQDTDAAGVVYFANVLSMCHEAYEASLAAASIDLKQFFSNPTIALPITHANVDFFRPMYCGEKYSIHLHPSSIDNNRFEIEYHIFSVESADQLVSKAITKHVCIDPIARTRIDIPTNTRQWLQKWSQIPNP